MKVLTKVPAKMSETLIVFEEPGLEFRYGQRVADPRHGLSLFGPFDADESSKPSPLSYVVLGTVGGIASFTSWSQAMNTPATVAPKGNYHIWPSFPGFEAAFCSIWPSRPIRSFTIDADKLIKASRRKDKHERAFEVVNLYMEGLRIASKLDEKIGVAVCVVPDEVWLNCRPESQVAEAIGASLSTRQKIARKAGQLELFESFDPMQYWLSPDFRRQLKARAMEYNTPIQIIRESTLRLSDDNPRGHRALTPLSDRMWNLGTTLYYKCGGKPWRLVSARDGVCYIGLAFRRTDDRDTACCAAQMFLNTGDGVVFLGEYGPWYSPKTKQFHLDKEAAKKLLEGVLDTYRELEGKELTEIFLHSRSTLGEDEYQGFQEACPNHVKLVGVRVRSVGAEGVRLYRVGNMPVIRGTFWKLSDNSGFLWGSGFKPQLGTYDGWETPIPLRIDIQFGDAIVERVAQDILALTKLNYNACKLGDSEPVTVGFSDAVGEILISNPKLAHRKPNFKFYI
jgi:hypothetical protein